jgi:hypothetical protein
MDANVDAQQATPPAAKIDAIQSYPTRTDGGDQSVAALPDLSITEQEMQSKMADIKRHYKKELASKDREISRLEQQYKVLAADRRVEEQDQYTMGYLEAELAKEKKLRLAAESKAKEDVEALSRRHKAGVDELYVIYEKQLKEKWQEKEDKEKRRREQEAAKIRKAEEQEKKKMEEEAARIREKKEKEKQEMEEEAAKIRDEEEKRERAKLARRNDLLFKSKELNAGIQLLLNRRDDGTLPLTKMTEVPSKKTCLDSLTELWKAHRDTIVRILPHELMSDHDFALEFEVETIVPARVYMLALQLWGFTPQEFLGTGWSPKSMKRLRCGLLPYEFETPLATLSVAVSDIYRILQHVTAILHAPPVAPAPSPDNGNNVTASQISSVVSTSSFQPAANGTQPTSGVFAVQSHVPTAPQASSGNSAPAEKICNNMVKKGFCGYGNKCKFSHNISAAQNAAVPAWNNMSAPKTPVDVVMTDVSTDMRASKPCNNVKKFGTCKRSDCPFFHPPGKHTVNSTFTTAASQNPGQNQATTFGNGQPVPTNGKPCWNEQGGNPCNKPNCRFTHQLPHVSVPSQSVALQAQANGDSRSTKPCRAERDNGRCTKPTCPYMHQNFHGPLTTPSMGRRGQANANMQNQVPAGYPTPHGGMVRASAPGVLYANPQYQTQQAQQEARQQALQSRRLFSQQNVFQGARGTNARNMSRSKSKSKKQGHGQLGPDGGVSAFRQAGGNVFGRDG